MWSDESQVEGIIPSFNVLVLTLLMQPERLLHLFAARALLAHAQFVVQQTTGSLSTELLPSSWSLACIIARDSSLLGTGICMCPPWISWFLVVYSSSISRFLWRVALPLSISTAPPQFGVTNRLDESALWCLLQVTDRVYSNTDPRADSCNTPLITNFQAENNPLATVLWDQTWN